MSYIGNTVDSVINGALNYGTQYSQQFSGNGSQTVFTLSAAPGSVNSIVADINGVAQYPGTDFTWSSGTSLTFTTAPVTGTNNILVRWAQTLPTGTPADGSVTSTKFTQAVIGGEYALVTSISGTNTITGVITGIASYAVGQTFKFVAIGANTGAVTINLNGIGAVAITKNGAIALVAGDIPSGATVIITHDGTRFQLMNVAVTAPIIPTAVYSVGGTVAASALTVTLDPSNIVFRNSTLTNGQTVLLQNASQLSLVVPSGATLGTVSGVQSRIVILALYNAGVIQLGVVNIAGGTQLDETNLLSTTVISSGASSSSVVYSSTALTNVPYKVVGIVDSNQTTAGTWTSAPSLVQGSGGQALMSMGSLGYGQTDQDVTGSRTSGTTYYNTTGRPIEVRTSLSSSGTNTLMRNGVTVGYNNAGSGALTTLSAIIPPGWSYSCTFTAALQFWRELR